MKLQLGIFLAASIGLVMEAPRGIDFVLEHSPTEHKYMPETMGGGVALFDANGDGRLDVFFVNGAMLPSLAREARHANRLYFGRADGGFEDRTTASGIVAANGTFGMGAATADYDKDGDVDLFVSNFGANELWRNEGGGRFTNRATQAGVAGGGWSVSAGFFDYDNDGWLDLFVARYLDWTPQTNLLCGVPFHTYCRPDRYRGTSNLLYRNRGDGTFENVSEQSGIARHIGKGMGVAFNDYDGDGSTDVFVSNDGMEQFLFRNRGDGTFEERAMEAGVALADDGRSYAGMGALFEDYDNDGRPDILVTNLAQEKFALYRNEGRGMFRYASYRTGLAALTVRHSGWGCAWADLDNDGWKDLVVAQSHVLDNVERVDGTLRYKEPPQVYRNEGGRFTLLRANAAAKPIAGRGLAVGDWNNDGVLDAMITALGERPTAVRGTGGGHWLRVKTSEGAWIRVGAQVIRATSTGGYLSASDVRAHFGLGAAVKADVEVTWPGGKKRVIDNVGADREIEVRP